MKKSYLLCTIICASQLYGMQQSYYKQLPPELRQEIINNALAQNNIEDAIKILQGLYTLQHGLSYDNLKNFSRLVHILATKFNQTPLQIAEQFETPIAQEYFKLTKKLGTSILQNKLEETEILINKGADVTAVTGVPNHHIKPAILFY